MTLPKNRSLPKTDKPLHKNTRRASSARLPKKPARVVEQQIASAEVIDGAAVVFQLERVCCGKGACKACRGGNPSHGPYWYAYWRAQRKTRSLYIGKALRSVREVLDVRAAREAANV